MARFPNNRANSRLLCRKEPRMRTTLTVLLLAFSLSGCGVAAAPCRGVSLVLKMIPWVGHAAAVPTDACAAAIDP